MAEIFPLPIYKALQSTLQNGISYADTVIIRKYRRTNIPEFSHHAIIITPNGVDPQPYDAGGQRRIINDIDLMVLIKMLSSEEDAVIADSPSSNPPNVGILAFYEDIFCLLYKNTLGGKIELIPGLKELDNKAYFNVIEDIEREEFVIESRIQLSLSGARFINP